MKVPENLYYTSEHEWYDHKTKRFGITDFAQDNLGDVVFFELTIEEGDEFEKGDTIGTIESVKTVSDIYAPFAGKLTAVNSEIESNPQLANEDPYGEGWLVELEMNDEAELKEMMNSEDYAKMLQQAE